MYLEVTFFFKTTLKRTKKWQRSAKHCVFSNAVVRRKKNFHVGLTEHIFIKSHWSEIFIMDTIFYSRFLLIWIETWKKRKKRGGNESPAIMMRLLEKVNVCLIDHCLHVSIQPLAVIKEPLTNTCSFKPSRPIDLCLNRLEYILSQESFVFAMMNIRRWTANFNNWSSGPW